MLFSEIKQGFLLIIVLIASVRGHGVSSGVLNGLDLKLLKTVTTKLNKNEAVSSFVISSLLSQVYLGAKGTTKSEMAAVLGAGPTVSFLPAYKSAIDYLSSGEITSVFNRIYLKHDFSIKQSFSEYLRSYYGADVNKFSSAAEAAEEINKAVALTTNNLIKKLVSERVLRDAKVVLVSALYFKDLWLQKFPVTERVSDFLTSDGFRSVDMMKLSGNAILYTYIPGKFEAISLPYKNEDYSMILLKPLQKTMASVQTMLGSLDSVDIAQVLGQMRPTPCDVSMPRFKIKARYENLNAVLQSMGMRTVFTNDADLSGISKDPLKIDRIIMEVVIDVTEDGTEAAAAAAIVTVGTTSVGPRSPPPRVQFVLDRPFVFNVWNRKHGMSLFGGYRGSV